MQIAMVQFGDTDETAALQAYRITRAAWAVTVPDIPYVTADSFVAAIRRPAPSHAYERALGYLNGVPAGCVEVQLPLKDNRDNASVEMWVAPEHRRQGVGRALYEYAADRVRALGRKRLTGETVQSVPGGGEFCAALEATAALPETRSRLDLAAIDREQFDAMLAECWTHAAGYRLVLWQGVPPASYIDHVAALDSRFFADAPLGALDWEPEVVDAERVRQSEQRQLDRGIGRYHAGMVHRASDRLVAWTMLGGPHDSPEHLWQNITIVDPPHRGHRLGMIVKLENLRHVRELRPRLQAVDTFNASSNEHMLAINRTMGFRAVDSWMQWQLTV
jgi:GNAT superfamily N-acetyltransferase